VWGEGGRTPRNVWRMSSDGFDGDHFATFPLELPDRCIRASTSERGCCPVCGAPWERITERTAIKRHRPNEYVKRNGAAGTGNAINQTVAGVDVRTTGWRQACDCASAGPVPCRVIEPFCGAGTTLLAATRLGRDAAGIELNADYIEIAKRRIEQGLRPGTARDMSKGDDSPLFGDER
ncbi:MAG: DNA methyltransferase, partial [Deltaproteobacteria bacterium]|nr:DNA methyltransferase [Deltaproteobacteria bacterium]